MKKWLWLAGLIFVLDQITKHWVVAVFEKYERLNVLPFFDLTLAFNKGAAFSFLADAGGWQRWFFAGIALVVSVVVIIWIIRLKPNEKWLACALALVLGGALGNLYDRVLLGHVVDFLLFYWHPYYFPAFNVADMGICIGAGMMFIDIFRDMGKESENPEQSEKSRPSEKPKKEEA